MDYSILGSILGYPTSTYMRRHCRVLALLCNSRPSHCVAIARPEPMLGVADI